jgi:tRNA pseudouridine55 synthase
MAVQQARAPRREVDGVLLLDKPPGLTSNAALQRAKRLLGAAKAGHTGTLDPLATGLLAICFGEATKFAQALLDADKEYVATVRFGAATSTGDAEGETIREAPVEFTRADLEQIIPTFLGRVSQVPPRHAALKFEGRKYYEYARAGLEIPRLARMVEIGSIEVVDFALPTVTLRIACGKGTYIRVLAEDLAAALGTCAHLAGLRRTASGPFTIDAAIGLDALEALRPVDRDALLLAVDAPLGDLARLSLDAATARALSHGRSVPVAAAAAGRYRGFDPLGGFLGLVEVADNNVRAVRLIRSRPTCPR